MSKQKTNTAQHTDDTSPGNNDFGQKLVPKPKGYDVEKTVLANGAVIIEACK